MGKMALSKKEQKERNDRARERRGLPDVRPTKASDTGDSPSNLEPEKGMFGLNNIMKSFYDYEPDSDDEYGNYMKNTFASNMIQSAFDTQNAKDLAYTQAEISSGMMNQASELQRLGTKDIMRTQYNLASDFASQEFQYNQQAQDNQLSRDQAMIGAMGQETRATEKQQQGSAERIASGRYDTDKEVSKTQLEGTKYSSDKSAEASMYGAKQSADASKYGSDKSAQASMYGADKSAMASMFGAKQSADASRYGADRSAQASMYGAKQSADATRFSATAQKEATLGSAAMSADASKYGADKSAQASMYGADRSAQASMYGADKSAQASMFGAQQAAKASMYGADKSAQASMYGAKQSADATRFSATKSAQASMYGANKSAQASMYGADKSAQASMYGADKSAQASMYGSDKQLEATKDTNLTSTRNITETGLQTRLTADNQQRLNALERADMNRYARSGARNY